MVYPVRVFTQADHVGELVGQIRWAFRTVRW